MTIYAVDYINGEDKRTYVFVPLNATPLFGKIGTTQAYWVLPNKLVKLPASTEPLLIADQEYNGRVQIRQLTPEQEKDLVERIQDEETRTNR